jgi:hypothetical protein
MPATSTSKGTAGASEDAKQQAPMFRHPLSKKYKDAASLEEVLDEKFPDGNFQVTVREANRKRFGSLVN